MSVYPDFVISVDVYGDEIAIFHSYDQCEKYCKAYGITPPSEDGVNEANTNAAALVTEDKEGVTYFIGWIPKKTPPETVSHEFLHLAFGVLDASGVVVTAKNHEALAYLQQYLTREYFRQVKDNAAKANRRASRKQSKTRTGIRRKPKKH